MPFDFSKTNMSLETINKYFESQGIELTSDEKKQINTIFQASDTWDDEQKAKGSDGVLNATEAALFVTKLASFSQKIKDGVNNLIKGLGLEFKPVRKEIEATPVDATRVTNTEKEVLENISNNKKSVDAIEALSKTRNINNSMHYSKASILEIALDQAIRRMPEVKNLKTAPERINKVKTKYPYAYKKALEKANYVTDMVMKNCKKYEIADLMPVVTAMLGYESGGFVFLPKVMVHGKSQFKGVMQVSKGMIKDIYNDTSSSDVKFVQELKSKYKTPEKLYDKIQSNVELGLQVGILVFKLKLRLANGNVARGVKNYCGDQYKYDYPLKVPTTVTV